MHLTYHTPPVDNAGDRPAIEDKLVPDMERATSDFRELQALAESYRFDLYSYLRLLTKLGLPVFTADVDDVAAIPASGRVVRYKLSEGLLICLSALRARKIESDEIERGTGCGNTLALLPWGAGLHDIVTPAMVDAGFAILRKSGIADDYAEADKLSVEEIYRAMSSLHPLFADASTGHCIQT